MLRREQKINDLRELKQLRKLYDQQVNRYAFETFKSLTKDRLGEIEYKKLIEEMEKELEAYTTEQHHIQKQTISLILHLSINFNNIYVGEDKEQ